jgi:hypothetical protein
VWFDLTPEPVVGSSPSSAAEESEAGEGEQSNEHDRSEHGSKQQHEQNPQYAERSKASTKASSAETPHPNQYKLAWQGAHEQRHSVQSEFEVPLRDSVDVGHKA